MLVKCRAGGLPKFERKSVVPVQWPVSSFLLLCCPIAIVVSRIPKMELEVAYASGHSGSF